MAWLWIMFVEAACLFLTYMYVCDSRLVRFRLMYKEKVSSGYATKLLLAAFEASEHGLTACFQQFIIYFFLLLQLPGVFFSENLHLSERSVISKRCINITYPAHCWWVLLWAIQGSSDVWFEGMVLVNCNIGRYSPASVSAFYIVTRQT